MQEQVKWQRDGGRITCWFSPGFDPNKQDAFGDWVMVKSNDRDPLLVEREKTHGTFEANARVWQLICNLGNKVAFGNDSKALAFEMIALKIARLLQNPNCREHWDDIAGYAKLGSEACDG